MRLRSIELNNVGIFEDAKAEFARDAAVIAGKNNSGKTSLLAAIAGQWQASVPRTAAALQSATFEPLRQGVSWEFDVDQNDLERICQARGKVYVPNLAGYDHGTILDAVRGGRLRVQRRYHGDTSRGMGFSSSFIEPVSHSFEFRFSERKLQYVTRVEINRAHVDDFVNYGSAQVFRFDADRSRASEKSVRNISQLDARGDELVTAFNNLHPEEQLQFLQIVRRVLPEVTRLKSVPSQEGRTQLRMWFGSDYRPELSFNLGEVGYGTANILVLLFAATMDPGPRILLIDEPSTYLHPGAVRELMAILSAYPMHQYIFATHSFFGLECFPNASFSLCKRSPDRDVVTVLNCGSGESADVRLALREVGASLTDVFAADQIIWVEGPSDVDALKEAIKALPMLPPRGLTVLPLVDTGGLEGRHGDLVIEVYRKLSTSSALIPRALHFVLDREGRSDEQVNDLKRRVTAGVRVGEASPGLSVYPAKMLENLFLDGHVVAEVLTKLAEAAGVVTSVAITGEAVEALWNTEALQLGTKSDRTSAREVWEREVHGARVLETTFRHFLGEVLGYRKTRHAASFACVAVRHASIGGQKLLEFVSDILMTRTTA